MKKVNPKLIVFSLLVTLVILFGGHFLFRSIYIETPIRQLMEEHPHIHLNKLELKAKEAIIQLNADQSFPLTKEYVTLYEEAKDFLGEREIRIKIQDKPNPTLMAVWDEMSFGIREGIIHGQFTNLAETVEQVSQMHGIRYEMKLEEDFFLISLYDGSAYLYRVFPLQPTFSMQSEVNLHAD